MGPGAHGWLVVDKPKGITSRDAVNRVQRWFPRGTKIGHTGTLDPLATGVLVLAIGPATKLAEAVQAMPKAYRATVRLGATSATDDADGEVTERTIETIPGEAQVLEALTRFVGVRPQLPPKFSALKLDGRRAYDLARRGQEVILAPRPVRIDRIDLVSYSWPLAEVTVECGKGTYVRSIARDLGDALGVGGLIQDLRRTRVGPFTAEMGIGVNERPAALKLWGMERDGTVR